MHICREVNKATGSKAKAPSLKAKKAKKRPRPRPVSSTQGQGQGLQGLVPQIQAKAIGHSWTRPIVSV